MTLPSTIDFRDINGLAALVSSEFGDFGSPQRVSQQMINTFADLTHDQQWIHVDTERARSEGQFGDTIAHGFLILSLATCLRPTHNARIVGHGNALNYGIEELRFLVPVIAGSSVHGRMRMHHVEEKRSGTLITQEMAIHVVGSEKPSVVFKWKLLYAP